MQDPSRLHFCLCLLDEAAPPAFPNVLFVTVDAAEAHKRAGVAGMAPAVRAHIAAAFEAALCGRVPSRYERARLAMV